jgi:alginate O-acetyltransferase complex protein AlgI
VRDQIYKPVARRFGRPWAVTAVFLFSGLVHEFVISFPAGGGWGLPTLYFFFQGLWVFLEKSDLIRTPRWVTVLVVVVPLPLLFHEPWMERVILPLL